MAKKEERVEKRRFEDGERKLWTKEQREEFLTNAEKLKPYIRHLTTPAPTEKKKSFFDDLPVVQ